MSRNQNWRVKQILLLTSTWDENRYTRRLADQDPDGESKCLCSVIINHFYVSYYFRVHVYTRHDIYKLRPFVILPSW